MLRLLFFQSAIFAPVLFNVFVDANEYWDIDGAGCSVVSSDEANCVKSTNWPNSYYTDDSCNFSISNGQSHQGEWYLAIVDFNTEEEYDFLTIEGVAYSGSMANAFGSGGLPYKVFNSSVIWASDSTVTATGWKVCAYESYDEMVAGEATTTTESEGTSTYWSVSGPCLIDADEPECITSSNYPNGYSGDESCQMFSASGAGLWLTIRDFDTEASYGRFSFSRPSATYSGTITAFTSSWLDPLGYLSWASDWSYTGTGWKVCASLTQEETTSTEGWNIQGPCSIDESETECIVSPSWPSEYGDSESCAMYWSGSTGRYLEVTAFNTESCCDYMSLSSVWYAGSDPGDLHGSFLSPTTVLTWSSDGSVTYPGWRICGRTSSNFEAFSVPTTTTYYVAITSGSTGESSDDDTDTGTQLAEIGGPILFVLFIAANGVKWWMKKKKKAQQSQDDLDPDLNDIPPEAMEEAINDPEIQRALRDPQVREAALNDPQMRPVVEAAMARGMAPMTPAPAPAQAPPVDLESDRGDDEAAGQNLGKPTFGGLKLAFDFDSAGQKGLSDDGYGSVGFGGRNEVADECINDVAYPPYWESKVSNEPASKFVPETTSMRLSILELMDRVAQATNGGGDVMSFEVHSVHRLENAHLWGKYFRAREAVAWDLNGLIRHQAKTSEVAPGSISIQMFIGRSRLKKEINEFYLFCSAPDDALKGLVETDKDLREYLNISDRLAKSMPMQEAPQHALPNITAGKQKLLLCRVCCGSIAQNEQAPAANNEDNNVANDEVSASIDIEPALLKGLASGDFQSWVQERAGTREYVVFNDALIYPEYLVEFSKKSPKK